MCNFFSAIVTKSGDLLYDLSLNSHEDLIDLFEIKDNQINSFRQTFARIEFTWDPSAPISHKKSWALKVDQSVTPDWFDHDKVKDQCWGVISKMFVRGHKKILLSSHYVLLGGAVVDKLVSGTIHYMTGDSRVGRMCGSSQVGEMLGSSQVGRMYGSSRVGEMYDSSRVGEMCDSSQVGVMYGSSRVGEMYGSSRVGEMYDSSRVGEMCDSSQVGVMYGSSRVGEMYGSSRVGEMYDSSRIVADYRIKK